MIHKILSTLLCIVLLASCNKEMPRTEYTHAIPADAREVALLHLDALAEKAGLADDANALTRSRLLTTLADDSPEAAALLEKILNNPAESGIDTKSPAYLFKAPSMQTAVMALKITDLEKWNKVIATMAKENVCNEPSENDGYSYADLRQAAIRLAYNNGTLLAVYADNAVRLGKLHAAITNLMKQGRDKSIHAYKHFATLQQAKGDITLMLTPDILPFDLRGILNWPQGTPLLGTLLFENGRIYANLQQADFNGETHESNQPFHPQNARELQQAIYSMMRGTPFNVELTQEELLTVTNLRALAEFAPDEPEVKLLYSLISEIEKLNLRGDGRRMTCTLVLNNHNVNALKQLVDFAKQFAE